MILFDILKSIGILLVVLAVFNLMIVVHELGHFLAARWRGLVVEKFAIWFGKPLWKKKINGVEYILGSIPAGGYVALPQLAPMEAMEGKVETPREQLPPVSALDKIIVAVAGPLFSFSLAVAFSLIVWVWGRPLSDAERTQVIGFVHDGSPAAEAGLMAGDKILKIDGRTVSRWSGMSADSIQWSILRSEGQTIALEIERPTPTGAQAKSVTVTPRVEQKAHWWNRGNLRSIGVEPSKPSIVAEVQPDTPGAKAGLQKGDVITKIDGQPFYDPSGIFDYVADHPAKSYDLTVERGASTTTLHFSPLGVRVASVEPESPASAAGLKPGNVIVAMDGVPLRSSAQIVAYVGSRAGVPIDFSILAGELEPTFWQKVFASLGLAKKQESPDKNQEFHLKITPQIPISSDSGSIKEAKIGFGPMETVGLGFESAGRYHPVHPTPIEQLRLSVAAIVNTLDAVTSRKSSVGLQHMGGPIMMLNAYYQMLSSPEGIRMALWFSVILNVNLALLNLLPIPVLDGGHITLAIIESIRRKPINVRVLEYVQTACALVIISFMLFIMFFDVQDLPFVSAKRPTLHFQKITNESVK